MEPQKLAEQCCFSELSLDSKSLSVEFDSASDLRGAAWWVAHFAWPVLLLIAIYITAIGFTKNHPIPYFLVSYAFLFVSLLLIERNFPFEKNWLKSDGQTWNDIGHTLINKSVAQGLAIFVAAVNLKEWIHPVSYHGALLWPTEWPMVLQVLCGLTLIEFVLYWAHRLPHENAYLWRLHALHHSATKLWVVNTGRFHFLESALKVVGLTFFMIYVGMPMTVIYWVAIMTAYIGIFTHCNVEICSGFWSYIFNTPTLHRWHHSPRLDEGNTNYGETVMLWDHVFGSFYNPARRPATDIGLNKGKMPTEFRKQLLWPFTTSYPNPD